MWSVATSIASKSAAASSSSGASSRGELWWQAHPFSISAAPDGRTLRLTVKAVGGYTRALACMAPGTRVLVDGPLGRFTADRRHSNRVALIAGGIGVTPLRAILEELPPGDIVFVHPSPATTTPFCGRRSTRSRAPGVHAWSGTSAATPTRGASTSSRSPHLPELIPDLRTRDVFVCGPPPMMRRTIASLREVGVPSTHIHSERFALAT